MKGNLKKYIKEIFNALKRREMAILEYVNNFV